MVRISAGSSAVLERDLEAEGALRCACGGELEDQIVHRYRFQDALGREVEAHNVPAHVCHRCGDVIVDPEVLALIESRMHAAFFLPRHVDLAR